MSNDLLEYVLFGSYFLASLILLVGALIPKPRQRRLSDWVMIVGMAICFLSMVAVTLLIFFNPSDFGSGRSIHEFWKMASRAAIFGTAGGLMLFSGGFLLSRFEVQRRLIHDEACGQGLSGSGESGGPQN